MKDNEGSNTDKLGFVSGTPVEFNIVQIGKAYLFDLKNSDKRGTNQGIGADLLSDFQFRTLPISDDSWKFVLSQTESNFNKARDFQQNRYTDKKYSYEDAIKYHNSPIPSNLYGCQGTPEINLYEEIMTKWSFTPNPNMPCVETKGYCLGGLPPLSNRSWADCPFSVPKIVIPLDTDMCASFGETGSPCYMEFKGTIGEENKDIFYEPNRSPSGKAYWYPTDRPGATGVYLSDLLYAWTRTLDQCGVGDGVVPWLTDTVGQCVATCVQYPAECKMNQDFSTGRPQTPPDGDGGVCYPPPPYCDPQDPPSPPICHPQDWYSGFQCKNKQGCRVSTVGANFNPVYGDCRTDEKQDLVGIELLKSSTADDFVYLDSFAMNEPWRARMDYRNYDKGKYSNPRNFDDWKANRYPNFDTTNISKMIARQRARQAFQCSGTPYMNDKGLASKDDFGVICYDYEEPGPYPEFMEIMDCSLDWRGLNYINPTTGQGCTGRFCTGGVFGPIINRVNGTRFEKWILDKDALREKYENFTIMLAPKEWCHPVRSSCRFFYFN